MSAEQVKDLQNKQIITCTLFLKSAEQRKEKSFKVVCQLTTHCSRPPKAADELGRHVMK
jgi:hypothetical protein